MLSSNSNTTFKRNERASSTWSLDSGYGPGIHEDTKIGAILHAHDTTFDGASQQQNQQTIGITRLHELQAGDYIFIKEEEPSDGLTTIPRLRLCTTDSNPSSPEPLSPASPSDVRRSHARKTASKLPSQAVARLTAWLDENRHHPYPTAETKQALAKACSITIKQVTTWFTNKRQRQLRSQETDGRVGIGHGQIPIQASRKGKKKDYGPASPIDGLLSTPRLSPCPSVSEHSYGEGDNWQCTFCRVSLTSKSWRRHEETQHHHKHQWTCLARGPRIQLQFSSSSICAFCELLDPDDNHFRFHHRIGDCMCKAEHERTFGRPDHLQQHAKNFHRCEKPLNELVREAWRKHGSGTTDDESWACGFCQEMLQTWDARATHIAGHFKTGLTMAQWRDNRVSRSTNPREYTNPDEPAMLDAAVGMGATVAGSFDYGSVQVKHHARTDSSQHEQPQPVSATEFMPMAGTIPDLMFDPLYMYGNPIDTFIAPATGPFTSFPAQATVATTTISNEPSLIDLNDSEFYMDSNPVCSPGVWNYW